MVGASVSEVSASHEQEPVIEAHLPLAEKVRRSRQWMDDCLARGSGVSKEAALGAARKQLELLVDACESALAQGASWRDLASMLGVPEQRLRALLAT